MRRVCAVLLYILLAGLCACGQTEFEETSAVSTTTEVTTNAGQSTAEATASPQRISSPNPFFDGMETERWVQGTSWKCYDVPIPMLMRTTKIREENDGSVYEIMLEIDPALSTWPLDTPPEGPIEVSLGEFLVQRDKILYYPEEKSWGLPGGTVVCQAKPWADLQVDDAQGTIRRRQAIDLEGNIANYKYVKSYTLEGDPDGLQDGWRFGLSLYFRWEKGKGLTGYYSGIKEGAMATEFGGIHFGDWFA